MTAVHKLYSHFAAMSEWQCDIGEHLEYIHDVAVGCNAQIIVELGPARGISTSALLAAAEITGGTVWSCDIVDHTVFPEVLHHPLWTYVIANDLDVVDDCPRPIDLLFIDSEHTYDQTLAEMRAYIPLVRSGGYVIMHDTTVWAELMVPAITDYTAEHPFASEIWFAHCNGLFVGCVA